MKVGRRWLAVVTVNQSKGGITGSRKRRNGKGEIPHCSEQTPSSTIFSIHLTQMLSKRVISIAKGRTILTPQAFSKGL